MQTRPAITTVLLAIAAGLFVFFVPPAFANPQLAEYPGARVNMEILEPFSVQGEGIPHPHEVIVALPASYRVSGDRAYPVLWVLDAPLMMRLTVATLDTLVIGNMAPEMIVIGIGSPAEEGLGGVGRRIMDFSPPGPDYYPAGERGEAWRALAELPDFPHLADAFGSLLIDQLRPQLAERYRFSGDHALFGHSAGGMFAAYIMFARPGSFSKFLIGSPYLDGVRGAVWDAERRFAGAHQDLDVDLFLAAGEAEVDDYFTALSGMVSSSARMAEQLRVRNYPGLEMRLRLMPGEEHHTIVPRLVSEGIRFLWRENIAELPPAFPGP